VVNWPLCCPSRATFLTGQYAHNHQVQGNAPPLGGFGRLGSTNTLAVWLQRAGYYTALIGKYLNGYEGSDVGVPPGYSEWHGSKDTYRFYGYVLLEDGELVTYGSPDEDPDDPAQPETYSTDVYTDKAVELIQRRAPSSQPFFLSYLAPHSGGPNPAGTRCAQTAKPAFRHIGAADDELLPRPPSFDEGDLSDKPPGLRERPPFSATDLTRMTRNYRCRLESLLAIDEGVREIVAALAASGELDETVVIYTSDNGFFHGEHRIIGGKNRPYEESVRVPLAIRGPGIPAGSRPREMVVNADLAPTILDATGAAPGRVLDGRSLLPLIEEPGRRRGREILLEGPGWDAVRTHSYAYIEYHGGANDGYVELYDLARDPFQLQSRHGDPAYSEIRAQLAERLERLRTCAGSNCRLSPLVRLLMRYRADRVAGRRCARRPIRAVVRGEEAGAVDEVELVVGGQPAGVDRSRPFRRVLPLRLFDRDAKTSVRATIEFIDGRRYTRDRRLRACFD
jgi:N-acetylglucosamine-6-sulfatase